MDRPREESVHAEKQDHVRVRMPALAKKLLEHAAITRNTAENQAHCDVRKIFWYGQKSVSFGVTIPADAKHEQLERNNQESYAEDQVLVYEAANRVEEPHRSTAMLNGT